jgi:putative ABC transport system permease protein
MYAFKTLFDQPLKFCMTACGMALCIILMLFLLSIYRGVYVGSVEYVTASNADLWILQSNATNVLRSTSLIRTDQRELLKSIPGISSVSPVLFILGTVRFGKGSATVYLTGFDPGCGSGGPPEIVKGSTLTANDQIILDQSFAAKYNIHLNDRIRIKNDVLKVVGLSSGTNMFVIQYAFITLAKAHSLLGFANIVSGYLVKVREGFSTQEVTACIYSAASDINVFDRETFIRNNIQEMESGILPLLYMVAFIGAVVLTAILSLILSINVLERRKDFAIMKALGSPKGFLPGFIIEQSMILTISGLAVGIIFFFPLIRVLEKISPEVSVISSLTQILTVCLGAIIIGLISSIEPIRKLNKIYPLEAFGK